MGATGGNNEDFEAKIGRIGDELEGIKKVIESSPGLAKIQRDFHKPSEEGNEIFPVLVGIKERTAAIFQRTKQ